MGDQAETWVTFADQVPADVQWLAGTELWRAKQVHAEATVRVEIRYQAQMTAGCRVLFGTALLYPLSVTPDHKRRRQIALCKERL